MIFLQHKVHINRIGFTPAEQEQPAPPPVYWEDVFAIPDPTKLNSVESAKQWIMANGEPGHTYRIIDATVDTELRSTVGKHRRFWQLELREETIKTKITVDTHDGSTHGKRVDI